VGLIRLRLGELNGAEEAFLEAHRLGWDPQPGLALLRLAQGNVGSAVSSIRDAVENPSRVPNWERPPTTELRMSPLLEAQVEIEIEAGDLEGAGRAAGQLERVARGYGIKALRAAAATARGRVLLAEGEAAAARDRLAEGVKLWNELGTPYETVRARMSLAAALRQAGNMELAATQLGTAQATFERLGAKLDARRAASELRPTNVSNPEERVFMFTDIVRSTDLVDVIGDEAWGHLVRWHNATLASLVAAHGGEVVRTTGDGFFVTFAEASSAIECAVAIQQALDEHRREHGFSPRVRIGLHRARASREGDDWSGVGVHAAARIGALAEGEEILASIEAAEAAGGDIARSDARTVSVKGISRPLEVVTVAAFVGGTGTLRLPLHVDDLVDLQRASSSHVRMTLEDAGRCLR
jgi:class 3 adenylate cyclase